MEKESIDKYIEDCKLVHQRLTNGYPGYEMNILNSWEVTSSIKLDERLSSIEDSIETLKKRISEELYEISDKLTYHESD